MSCRAICALRARAIKTRVASTCLEQQCPNENVPAGQDFGHAADEAWWLYKGRFLPALSKARSTPELHGAALGDVWLWANGHIPHRDQHCSVPAQGTRRFPLGSSSIIHQCSYAIFLRTCTWIWLIWCLIIKTGDIFVRCFIC